MNEHLISPIHLPSSFFYRFRFQAVTLKRLQAYLQAINALHVDQLHLHQRFDEELLRLKEQCPQQVNLEPILQDWQNLKPFAHIRSSKLISLIQHTITPASYILQGAIELLKQDLKSWRPQWIQKYPIAYLATLEEKQQQLLAYRTQCLGVLQKRCQYASLNIDRHCDDDGFIIQTKISKLLPGQIEPNSSPRLALSDDARITLYDLMGAQDETMIEKIRRTPYNPPKVIEPHANHTQNLSKLYRFLELERQAVEPTKPNWFQRWGQSIRGVSTLLASPLEKALRFLYDFRYLVALSLSLALYFWFVPPIIGFTSAIFGQTIANLTQGVLFYGATLMPVWVFAFSSLKTLTGKINRWILSDKLNNCYECLSAIEGHNRLHNKLKVGILDTYHYDIQTLKEEIIKAHNDIKTIHPKLKHIPWYERWFMTSEQADTFKSTNRLLSAHKHLLKKNTLAFCKHLIQRVSVDLITLTENQAFGIKPLMAPNQLQALRDFISHVGNEDLLKAYDKATSLKPQFIKHLNHQALSFKDELNNPLIPWGGEKPNQAALRGWQTLCLNAPNQVIAMVIQMLQSNQDIDQNEFELNLLTWGESSAAFKKAFSNYLFRCLPHLPPKTVFLLDESHKTQILGWYQEHQSLIEDMKQIIKDYIKQPQGARLGQLPLEQAANLVWLLDGAQVALTLLGEREQAQNELRSFIEEYTGAQSQIIFLNRFFPKQEQPQIMRTLCVKRLDWLMHHPDTKLQREDIELFHSPILAGQIDYENIIRHHSAFLSEDLKPILKTLKKIGVIEDRLIAEYEFGRQQKQQDPILEHRSALCVK